MLCLDVVVGVCEWVLLVVDGVGWVGCLCVGMGFCCCVCDYLCGVVDDCEW